MLCCCADRVEAGPVFRTRMTTCYAVAAQGLASDVAQPCPYGSYCTTGRGAPVPCPLGTYSGTVSSLQVVHGSYRDYRMLLCLVEWRQALTLSPGSPHVVLSRGGDRP